MSTYKIHVFHTITEANEWMDSALPNTGRRVVSVSAYVNNYHNLNVLVTVESPC